MTQNSSPSVAGGCAQLRIAGEGVEGKDLTQIQDGSQFETRLRELILTARPRSVIETGTYLGKGTTRIIAAAMRDAGLNDTAFFTIECNPDHHRQARVNLTQAGLLPLVSTLLGLSVPRSLLPSLDKIHQDTVENPEGAGIFVDHKEHERATLYHRETDFPGIPEDLLGACLRETGYRPDMVLLDSGGHMGNVEFNYLIARLQGECIVVLDDIRHIKHHASFKQLQADRRFTVLTASDEKFGFCIARFTPHNKTDNGVKRILWVRTDSIGDNILAMAMLPSLRDNYPNAEITVLCQQHIVELYEACPLVNRVIGFNRLKALQDDAYRTEMLGTIQAVGADLALNPVYSREPLTDLFTAASGARQRFALEGNLCNISAVDRERNNRLYTGVLSSEGENKTELERHKDFLRGLGTANPRLELSFWVTQDDMAFAKRLFRDHGLTSEKTVALFAGAQHAVRLYDHYGTALADICQANDFAVLALGAAGDQGINQLNLDAIGTRVVNLSGALTLRQSAALLSLCRLAVGAETGLAHMACAVETPNVILLGGGHFGRFMPYSPLTSIVALPLECYGCNWQCRYNRVHCVRDVAPSAIEEAVRQTLAQTSDKPRLFVASMNDRRPGNGEPHRGGVMEFISSDAITVIPLP